MISLRGASQWGVDAWNGLVGTLDFVHFKALSYKVRGSALPRAWHGSVRTYLTVGCHLIVPRGDFTRCMRTVDYPKLAVIFNVINELVTTETDLHLSCSSLSILKLGQLWRQTAGVWPSLLMERVLHSRPLQNT